MKFIIIIIIIIINIMIIMIMIIIIIIIIIISIIIIIYEQRMDDNRLPKKKLNYKPKRRRDIGRPRTRWEIISRRKQQAKWLAL